MKKFNEPIDDLELSFHKDEAKEVETKDELDRKRYLADIHRYFGMNCLQLEKLEKARINLEYALEFYKSESL